MVASNCLNGLSPQIFNLLHSGTIISLHSSSTIVSLIADVLKLSVLTWLMATLHVSRGNVEHSYEEDDGLFLETSGQ